MAAMSYTELNAAMKAAGWTFDGEKETFHDRNGIRLDYGELMALVPGTTECELAAWAEDLADRNRASRSGRALCCTA